MVKNTLLLESALSKKHNATNCHTVREAVAAGIVRVAKEPTEDNLADLFTKPLSNSRRNHLLASIVWGPFVRPEWISGNKRKAEELKEGEEEE